MASQNNAGTAAQPETGSRPKAGTPVEPIKNFFVCIGAQKAGTTWLARMLETHPDLFLTPVKEIHYFDHVAGLTEHLSGKRRRSRYRKYHQRLWTQWHRFGHHRAQWRWYHTYIRSPIDDAWYASLFRHRGSRRFAGEVTPEYAIIGRDGFAHLRRLAPDARILFIMRNPVARTWSQVLHQCRSRGLDATKLTTEQVVAMVDEPRFKELGDYIATLDALFAVFPPEQIMTMFYEEMHADRLATLQKVCSFIGIAFAPDYFTALGRRFNRSQDAPLPDGVRLHLRTLYRPLAIALRAKLGHIPDAWIQEFDLGSTPGTTGAPRVKA